LEVVNYIELFSYNGTGQPTDTFPAIQKDSLYGLCQINGNFVILAGDISPTLLYYIKADKTVSSYDLEGIFRYGPVAADLNRDGQPEVVVASSAGILKIVTIDTTNTTPSFSSDDIDIDSRIGTNPIIADINEDQYPDVIVGGMNAIYAYNYNLISLADFPITVDSYYPDDSLVSSPIVADINNDGRQDIICVMSSGNCYALGPDNLYGFPLSAGGVKGDSILTYGHGGDPDLGRIFVNAELQAVGSPVIFEKSDRGGLGFLGADGWFYSYDVWFDADRADWAMYGGGAGGGFLFDEDHLDAPAAFSDYFPENDFFCYPNPSLDGRTTLRYYLGDDADVNVRMFDLSGVLVYENNYSSPGGGYDEQGLDLSFLPTGVYRCRIKVDFGGSVKTAFTDLAIVK
jgi:hypothetical protein